MCNGFVQSLMNDYFFRDLLYLFSIFNFVLISAKCHQTFVPSWWSGIYLAPRHLRPSMKNISSRQCLIGSSIPYINVYMCGNLQTFTVFYNLQLNKEKVYVCYQHFPHCELSPCPFHVIRLSYRYFPELLYAFFEGKIDYFGIAFITRRDWVIHICVRKLGYHWFK